MTSSSDNSSQVMRPKRVKVSPLDQIAAFLTSGNRELKFPLRNLSSTGVGLINIYDDFQFNVGEKLLGKMSLKKETLPLSIEVKHISDKCIGCQFTDDHLALSQAIRQFFEAEITGLNLNAVSQELMGDKESSSDRDYLFSDGFSNELFYSVIDETVSDFRLSFFGNYLTGGFKKDLRYGRLLDETGRISLIKLPSIILYENRIPQEILVSAKKLIHNIRDLEGSHLRQIFQKINNAM